MAACCLCQWLLLLPVLVCSTAQVAVAAAGRHFCCIAPVSARAHKLWWLLQRLLGLLEKAQMSGRLQL